MTYTLPKLLQERHPFRQWKTWSIPGSSHRVTGYSRSNDKTFFHLPALQCCIDAGLCEGRQPNHVLLTHTHSDHSADLEFLASKSTGVDLYLPKAAKSYVENYIQAKREMSYVAAFEPERANPLRIHGLEGGDSFRLGKNLQYNVRVIDCVHRVPCIGFCFSEIRRRLKPEFESIRREFEAKGESKAFGTLMGKKRKEGIEIQEEYEQPLFAFLGDTHIDVFAQNPWIFEYPVLFTECTFLYDSELERANEKQHIAWSQLRPIIEKHPENTFVLTHFSLRYSDREILAFFSERAEAEPSFHWDKIVLWAQSVSLLPEQHQRS